MLQLVVAAAVRSSVLKLNRVSVIQKDFEVPRDIAI